MEKTKKRKFAIVFRCAVPKCTYVSKRYYNLQRHVKVHNKGRWRSKRFPCPCCAYAGSTRAHLRRHVGNKHPTVELTKNDLIGLAYEDFVEPDNEAEAEEERDPLEVQPPRHTNNNHKQTSQNDLIRIAYEEIRDVYADPDDVDLDFDLELNQQQLNVVVKQEEFQMEEEEGEQVLVNGPVTVLQMVTPPRTGELHSEFALEGEAFRLIPVELLPEELSTQDP